MTGEPSKARGIDRAAKGTRVELTAIKALEADGYTVHRCVRTAYKANGRWYSHANDVFGAVDIIAKRLGERRTRWIQVTADKQVSKKKAKLAAVPWSTDCDSVEIWRWVDGRGPWTDRRGQPVPRSFFEVYHLDEHFQRNVERRVWPSEGASS